DVTKIIQLCLKHKFELIPLIQTFGHLEFALKHAKFRPLREIDDFPAAVCPRNQLTFTTLIKPIIDQVIQLHLEAGHKLTYLHIGSDEVFHMGACNRCRDHSKEDLYLTHVSRVARYARDTYAVKPIIWDDML